MPRAIVLVSAALLAASVVSFADPSEGKQVWQFSTGTMAGGTTPAVADGRVFVTTGLSGNRVFALNAANGKKIWERKTNDNGPWSPIAAGGRVYVTTESCSIYSYDARNGGLLWSKVISGSVWSFVAADETNVLAVAEQGGWSLVCWSGRTGTARWRAHVGAEAIGAPVLADDVVYVATRDGVVHAIDAATGKERWAQDRGATSPPVVADGRLLLASEEGGFHVMAVSASDGTGDWQFTASRAERVVTAGETRAERPRQEEVEEAMTVNRADGTSRPCVVGGAAFVGTSDGRLVCLDTSTGAPKWEANLATGPTTAPPPVASPVVAGGRVYVGTMAGEFKALSAEDGKELWSYRGNGFGFNSAPAVTGGRVYAVSQDGVVHCIEAGTPEADGWPMWGGSAAHAGPVAAPTK